MTVSYVSANNAAGENNGNTTTAGTVAITPTLPLGTASGNRVFVIQCHSGVSGTAPSSWNVLFKDTVVGTGAVAASAGLRYMSCYWRDYDGVWTMPSFALASSTNLSHWIGVVSLSTTAVFAAPSFSFPGSDFGTPNTAHSANVGTFASRTNGMLIIGSVTNDLVTSSSPTLTQSGATFGTVTERCDGGTATGNDVAGTVHTVSVTAGALTAATFAATLSAATEGGSIIVQQTDAASTDVRLDGIGTGAQSTSTGSLSWTHPGTTGSNVWAVAAVAFGSFGSGSYTGYTRAATFGGRAMSSIVVTNSDYGDHGWLELFALANPPTGSQTVTATCTPVPGTNPLIMTGNSLTYVNVGSFAGAKSGTTGATPTITITSATNDVTVAAFSQGAALTAINQALRYVNNTTVSANACDNLLIADAPGAASVSFTGVSIGDSVTMVGSSLQKSRPPNGAEVLTVPVVRSAMY